jgi:hypothetical protein
MVRKDPLKIRGPAPPGGRRPQITEGPARPTTLFELRPEVEYNLLWATLIETMKQNTKLTQLYASLSVPGVPVKDLEEIRDSIDQIIKKRRDNE